MAALFLRLRGVKLVQFGINVAGIFQCIMELLTGCIITFIKNGKTPNSGDCCMLLKDDGYIFQQRCRNSIT